ncbi:transposase, partial [Streptomyces sp. PH10-H1]
GCRNRVTTKGPVLSCPRPHTHFRPYGHPHRPSRTRSGLPQRTQAGKRWVVERTHSWMNGYGKLRRCTEKNSSVVDFYLHLAAALVTLRMLIRRATNRYRWDNRPTTQRLK